MAFSELQVALAGAGVAVVVMVLGYNAWLERKHRKAAERIFKGGQDDVLVGGEQATTEIAPAAAELRREPGERMEPRFDDEEIQATDRDAAIEEEAPPAAKPVPLLPAEAADPAVDCILQFAAAEPIPAPAVWAIRNAWSGDLSKPVHWLVRSEVDGAWWPIDADEAGRYREWAVALQLVDRRGPVSDGELGRFFDGVQQLSQQTAATLELPSRGETVIRAGKLDEFCAAVDIQFVLHIVEASGGVFAGTKLRGVAEAAGLALEGDGVFRARDANGAELFTLANMGAERLEAESIKSLATHGLTLSLDVPRVANGVMAFDRMLAAAQQVTLALGGVLVDAQRAPLSDVMIAAIRAKTAELQRRMSDGDIAPGSVRALRLFS
jgi:hypothetical protein